MPAATPPREPAREGQTWRGGLVFPGPCEVCRSWSGQALCDACVQRLAPIRPRCRRCGLALGVAADRCGSCLQDPPQQTGTVCAVDYGPPWDGLIARFKYHGSVELADPLASLITRAVASRGGAPPLPDWVVPIPLSRERLAERGYNQAWELARRVARSLQRPTLVDALERLHQPGHQAALSRVDRLQALRSAFWVADGASRRLLDTRVALVDDVMTTGATADAAAQALLRGGAAAVEVWVLARTPDRRETAAPATRTAPPGTDHPDAASPAGPA